MRPIVVVAAVVLFCAAPGIARAGGITPVQYAYGGGSNGAAVLASRPPATSSGGSAAPAGAAAPGRSGGGSTTGETPVQPLVGLASSPAEPADSFGALHQTIPRDVLWALALAVACALSAWLLRRSRGAG